jgi:hypothetical protein
MAIRAYGAALTAGTLEVDLLCTGDKRGQRPGGHSRRADIPSTHDIPAGIPKWRRLSVDLDDFQLRSAALCGLQKTLNICR